MSAARRGAQPAPSKISPKPARTDAARRRLRPAERGTCRISPPPPYESAQQPVRNSACPPFMRVVLTDQPGSIAEGAPVCCRQVQDGRVGDIELLRDGGAVAVYIHIQDRNAALVRERSVLWKASGIHANLKRTSGCPGSLRLRWVRRRLSRPANDRHGGERTPGRVDVVGALCADNHIPRASGPGDELSGNRDPGNVRKVRRRSPARPWVGTGIGSTCPMAELAIHGAGCCNRRMTSAKAYARVRMMAGVASSICALPGALIALAAVRG